MTHPVLFTVLPVRFSDDPPAMIEFLRTLGLVDVVTTEGDSYAELRAGAGRILIHGAKSSASGAESGDTDLCLQVPSIDAAAAALSRNGIAVRVWDESYGRQAAVTGTMGETIGINEEQTDLYGYVGHDEAPGSGLAVTAIRPSHDFAADAAFFKQFGFQPDANGSQWWQAMRSSGGVIGLHVPRNTPSFRESGSGADRIATAGLGFETLEDLDALATRLSAAGYPAEVVEEKNLRAVHLTDPDGKKLEIHPVGA